MGRPDDVGGRAVSMYGMVFGDAHTGDRVALAAALLDQPDGDWSIFGRIRDVWFEKQPDGPPRIAVYTRNGGGNRDDYSEPIEKMQAHPLYLLDRDDDFDSTYATFYFSVPETCDHPALQPYDEVRAVIVKLARDVVDTDARWLEAIDRIGGTS